MICVCVWALCVCSWYIFNISKNYKEYFAELWMRADTDTHTDKTALSFKKIIIIIIKPVYDDVKIYVCVRRLCTHILYVCRSVHNFIIDFIVYVVYLCVFNTQFIFIWFGFQIDNKILFASFLFFLASNAIIVLFTIAWFAA